MFDWLYRKFFYHIIRIPTLGEDEYYLLLCSSYEFYKENEQYCEPNTGLKLHMQHQKQLIYNKIINYHVGYAMYINWLRIYNER